MEREAVAVDVTTVDRDELPDPLILLNGVRAQHGLKLARLVPHAKLRDRTLIACRLLAIFEARAVVDDLVNTGLVALECELGRRAPMLVARRPVCARLEQDKHDLPMAARRRPMQRRAVVVPVDLIDVLAERELPFELYWLVEGRAKRQAIQLLAHLLRVVVLPHRDSVAHLLRDQAADRLPR